MPDQKPEETAAQYLERAQKALPAEVQDREGGIPTIQGKVANAALHIVEEQGITAELRGLTDELNSLYEGEPMTVSHEIHAMTWKHEADNNKRLRELIRRAKTVFASLKGLRNFNGEKGDTEREFLERWLTTAREKLQFDERAIAVFRKILLSDTPNFTELADVLDAKRAHIYGKALPLEHGRFRTKVKKEVGKVAVAEQEWKEKEEEEDTLLDASIGHVLSEEDIEELASLATPDQVEKLYKALEDKGCLREGSVFLLQVGAGKEYISWEMNGNTIKAVLRRTLTGIQEGKLGPINHVHIWRNQKKYYDAISGSTAFTATSTVDGGELRLRKNNNGDLSADSVRLLREKEQERQKGVEPSSEDILAHLDHYLVNIIPEKTTEESK